MSVFIRGELVMINCLRLILVAVLFVICGCAVQVPIDAQAKKYTESPVHRAHSKVVIFVSPEQSQAAFGQQGVLAVGMLLNWQMVAGPAMAASSKHFFGNYFRNVEVREQAYEIGACDDCALAVRPTLKKVSVNKITMQSSVSLAFEIFDSSGARVLTLPVKGKSKFMTLDRLGVGIISASVPGVSSIAGNSVLSKSVEDAFADAFWRLHLAMKEHTETGALARNWLPRELRKKQSYGRYEFSAERAILAVGCQLTQDGLRLVKTGMGELYEAYCWQHEPFLVDCDGSQCRPIFADPALDNRGFALE